MRKLDDGWYSFCEWVDKSCIEARVEGEQAWLRTTEHARVLPVTKAELADFVAKAKSGELDSLIA